MISRGVADETVHMRGVRVHAEVAGRRALEQEQRRCAEGRRHRIPLVAPRRERPLGGELGGDVRHRRGAFRGAAQRRSKVDHAPAHDERRRRMW